MDSATALARTNSSGELGPAQKLQPQALPNEIRLSEHQQYALAFASRVYKIVTAKVQTFQTGSVSSGNMNLAGVQRSFGAWEVFGATGTINQNSVNQFRTDVQLKLIDEKTGHNTFISRALPFAITLALDPGDTLAVYYAVGGLSRLYQPGDFGMAEWTPFFGKSLTTGQIVPFGPLPGLLAPRMGAGPVLGAMLALFDLLLTLGFTAGSSGVGIFGLILIALGALPIFFYTQKKKRYKEDFAESRRYSSGMPI